MASGNHHRRQLAAYSMYLYIIALSSSQWWLQIAICLLHQGTATIIHSSLAALSIGGCCSWKSTLHAQADALFLPHALHCNSACPDWLLCISTSSAGSQYMELQNNYKTLIYQETTAHRLKGMGLSNGDTSGYIQTVPKSACRVLYAIVTGMLQKTVSY